MSVDGAAQRQARWRRHWRQRTALSHLLLPLAALMGLLVRLRTALYRTGLFHRTRLGCPVIVVGNVTVGGAGKTPVVLALVRHLQQRGLVVGVISRGYGRTERGARVVTATSPPDAVGDEPLLIHRATQAPTAVAERRADAGRLLLQAHPGLQVLVCDDGLQHLALARTIEWCVFNDEGLGNGRLLPAGPLREPWPRPVDAVLHAGPPPPVLPGTPTHALQRRLAPVARAADGTEVPLEALRGEPVHAVAGIARPESFFRMLRDAGLTLAWCEPRADHDRFTDWEGPHAGARWTVCTAKDAAKIWPRWPGVLAIDLNVELPTALLAELETRLAASPA